MVWWVLGFVVLFIYFFCNSNRKIAKYLQSRPRSDRAMPMQSPADAGRKPPGDREASSLGRMYREMVRDEAEKPLHFTLDQAKAPEVVKNKRCCSTAGHFWHLAMLPVNRDGFYNSRAEYASFR